MLSHYPTPLSLFKRYREILTTAAAQQCDGTHVARGLLAGLRRDGYGRGLGTEKAKQVYDMLFASGWALARQ